MKSKLTAALLVLLCAAAVVLAMVIVRRELEAMVREAVAKALAHDLPILEDLDAVNAQRQRLRIASLDTAGFIDEHMPTVKAFPNRFELLKHSIASVDKALTDGLYCEFGVFEGTTIRFIAGQTKKTIHGFDSFEGLPEDWRTGVEKGAFKMSGLPSVPDNANSTRAGSTSRCPAGGKITRETSPSCTLTPISIRPPRPSSTYLAIAWCPAP